MISFRLFNLFRSINNKWLEPYEGVGKFKKRINELKASEVKIIDSTFHKRFIYSID